MSSDWIIILISLVCCAFFSGMEIAFLTANKLRIELENKQNYLPARVLSFFVKKPSRFIATCLVGNKLISYGMYQLRTYCYKEYREISLLISNLDIETLLIFTLKRFVVDRISCGIQIVFSRRNKSVRLQFCAFFARKFFVVE